MTPLRSTLLLLGFLALAACSTSETVGGVGGAAAGGLLGGLQGAAIGGAAGVGAGYLYDQSTKK